MLTVDKVKLVTLWAGEDWVARDWWDWGFDVLVVPVDLRVAWFCVKKRGNVVGRRGVVDC